MNRMIKFLSCLFVFALLFEPAGSARAGLLFALDAEAIDAEGSFSTDDVVTGAIELDAGAAQAGAVFSEADLLGFSFSVGDVLLDLASSVAVSLSGQVSPDGNGFSLLTFDFETLPLVNGCGDQGCFAAFDVGLIDQAVFINLDVLDDPGRNGLLLADIAFARVLAVSEPGTLTLLFAGGLLVVLVAARRFGPPGEPQA